MADITYWGLTSTKGTVTIADTSTATIDDLITAVAADEGLPTDYYQLSKSTDPSNTLSSIVGDSTAPASLDDLGIGDGDTVFCTTAQENLTKQERQIQKLEIAQVKRQAGGDNTKAYYRTLNTYDETLLPDTYNGNEAGADDNANGIIGGVISSVSITTPYTRNNGSAWNPAITTIYFTSADANNYDGSNAEAFTEATGTPVFDINGHLSAITIVTGGLGYRKWTGPGYMNGQVIVNIFIIQDNSTGDPDSREIANRSDQNINVVASDVTSLGGLQPGRPWT